jgi:hypothetical protein
MEQHPGSGLRRHAGQAPTAATKSQHHSAGKAVEGTIPLSAPVCDERWGQYDLYWWNSTSNPDPYNALLSMAQCSEGFRPFNAYNSVGVYQFTGTSTYHSLQATLSHNGRNLQYFATYTRLARRLGTVATNESDGAAWADPIDTRNRSWGVLPFDRTHVFNCLTTGACRNRAWQTLKNGFHKRRLQRLADIRYHHRSKRYSDSLEFTG